MFLSERRFLLLRKYFEDISIKGIFFLGREIYRSFEIFQFGAQKNLLSSIREATLSRVVRTRLR